MKKWYIVQAFSGFEKKVADTIKDSIKSKSLEDKIEEVLVPLHEVTEVKRGKRVQRKKIAATEAKAKTIRAPIIVSFFVGQVTLKVSCLTS